MMNSRKWSGRSITKSDNDMPLRPEHEPQRVCAEEMRSEVY